MKHAPPWWAYAALAASMALVGSYVGLSKVLLSVFPVFLLAWLRFGLGALAMLHWLRRPADEPRLDTRTRALLFLESLLGNFLFSICMLYGMRHSSALAAGVVMAALPAVVALLSRVFLRETLAPRTLMAIACAVFGIAMVALGRDGAAASAGVGSTMSSDSSLGLALLLAAVVCEASYVVIGKRLTGQLSAKRISASVNLWGLLLMTPLGLWQAADFAFLQVKVDMWWLLLFYSLAASVWTVWLWMMGLRHVPASSAGVFTVMLPVSAAAVGLIFLGERLSQAQGLALGVALAGLLLATWSPRRT